MEFIVRLAWILLFAEIAIVICFVVLIYGIKIYQKITYNDEKKYESQVRKIFISYITNKFIVRKSEIKFLNKDLLITLRVATELDVTFKDSPDWLNVKTQLIEKHLVPEKLKRYSPYRMYKRFCSVASLEFYFEAGDIPIVIKLLSDPVLLISVTAAEVGFKVASPPVINAAIDIFSHYGHLRQAMYSNIAEKCGPAVEAIITERLSTEVNLSIRGFCYRLLSQFPATLNIHALVKKDLEEEDKELRLSALKYASKNPTCHDLISPSLHRDDWAERAIAAKMLGEIHDYSAIPALEKALSDNEWWVRVNAAEALFNLGEKGIDILKAQTFEKNDRAFDAASKFLLKYKNPRST